MLTVVGGFGIGIVNYEDQSEVFPMVNLPFLSRVCSPDLFPIIISYFSKYRRETGLGEAARKVIFLVDSPLRHLAPHPWLTPSHLLADCPLKKELFCGFPSASPNFGNPDLSSEFSNQVLNTEFVADV